MKDGLISYSTALSNMVIGGGINEPSRYERSTQTAYKSMSLIKTKDSISPISIAFVDGKIDYKSLILSQCFKKQYKKNEGPKIRPLIVTLCVLKKIYDNEETRKFAWLDPYDYLNFLTEVRDYSEIDDCISKIINSKSLSKGERKVSEVKDCDIWYNMFVTTGLFEKNDPTETYKISLNLKEMELINYLINNHFNSPLIDVDPSGKMSNDDYWLQESGSIATGLVPILPYFKRTPFYHLKGFSKDTIKDVLYLTLVEGLTTRETDNIVLGLKGTEHEGNSNGFFSQIIIKSYGIPTKKGQIDPLTNARGIFKPFKNYLSLLRLSPYYDSYCDIIEILLDCPASNLPPSRNTTIRKIGGENIIYYGTPGCGKSYLVNDLYSNLGDTKIFRTVFHPDYSNTDFVGQIIPKIDENDSSIITYDFEAGIFTKALSYAYDNPDKNIILIIEEINRGNASAIFGEIFQLLDREITGESMYGIKNYKIAEQLNQNEDFDIKIPSNMSIVATMNTSDQNVYSLDTAFKRRWTLKKIRNTFADLDNPNNELNDKLKYKRLLAKMYVPGSSITWREFVEKVNLKISERGKTFSIISEDKEIGVFFVTKKLLSDSPNNTDKKLINSFGEKVLMYIWNDIAKTNIGKWFDGCNTLDDLLDAFEKNASTDSLNVFKDNNGKYLFNKMLSNGDSIE